jgi:hypothetical protein
MVGLVLSEVLLFAIVVLMGAAVGWFARGQVQRFTAGAVARDVQVLREGHNEARVRRTRSP